MKRGAFARRKRSLRVHHYNTHRPHSALNYQPPAPQSVRPKLLQSVRLAA
ncbi:transposase [Dyella acidisoli]